MITKIKQIYYNKIILKITSIDYNNIVQMGVILKFPFKLQITNLLK